MVQASMSFSGPLPPPSLLALYNDAVPNGADRILSMTERQEVHRQGLERVVIHGDARRADRGLYVGAGYVGLSIVLGFILVLFGHDIAGVGFVGFSLSSVTGVFIYGTRSRRKERERKVRLLTGREGE